MLNPIMAMVNQHGIRISALVGVDQIIILIITVIKITQTLIRMDLQWVYTIHTTPCLTFIMADIL